MAFTRFNGTVEPFAKDATGTNRTVFGDTLQSDDIDDNLNSSFKKGWEIVGINDNPTKQDFNGLAYTVSNLVAYLYQQGIAEYNSAQKYVVNSIVMASDGKLYRSLTGDETTPNVGNDPLTDTANWKKLSEGDNTQRFKVADAIDDDEALSKGQLLAEIKDIDGAGSEIDADLVRGLPADFTSNKNTNGYQKLPSELILQWGDVDIDGGTTVTVTFPIAFPSNALQVYTTSTTVSGDEAETCVRSFTQTDADLRTDASQTVRWLAIGY